MVLVHEPGRPRWHMTSVTPRARRATGRRRRTSPHTRGAAPTAARPNRGRPNARIPAGDQPTNRHQGPVAMAEPLTQHQPATATATPVAMAIDVDASLGAARPTRPRAGGPTPNAPRSALHPRTPRVGAARQARSAGPARVTRRAARRRRHANRARTPTARARPSGPGRRPRGRIRLCFPYNARLLERVRSIPSAATAATVDAGRSRRRAPEPRPAGATRPRRVHRRAGGRRPAQATGRGARSRRLHGRRRRERPARAPRARWRRVTAADLRRQPAPTPMGRRDRLVRAHARRPRTPPRRRDDADGRSQNGCARRAGRTTRAGRRGVVHESVRRAARPPASSLPRPRTRPLSSFQCEFARAAGAATPAVADRCPQAHASWRARVRRDVRA